MKMKNKELPRYKILLLYVSVFIVCFLPPILFGIAKFGKIKQLVRSRSDLTSCNISVLVVIATVTVGGTGLEVRETGNCNITVSCCKDTALSTCVFSEINRMVVENEAPFQTPLTPILCVLERLL